MTFNDKQAAHAGSPHLLRLRAVLFLIVVLFLCVAGIVTGRAVMARPASAVSSGPTECEWSVLTSINTHVYNVFHGVAPIASDDVWAVGSSGNGNFGQLTLMEHWDGATWTVFPSPNPGALANEIEDVVALSSNNVWAVGYYNVTGNMSNSLILHWDGVMWTQVASPNPASFRNDLYDIEAISPTDIWAVGHSWNAGSQHTTLIKHWDGTAWSVVPSPNANIFQNHLTSVSALASNDVWAVGQYMSAPGFWQTLIMHWDGSAWTIVASPNVLSMHNYLESVSVLSPTDIWAVGFKCTGNCSGFGGEEPLTMHWDGTAWTIIPTPDLDADFAYFEGVTVIAPNDVWAVGLYAMSPDVFTLAEHWDGASWSQVTVPSPDPHTCCPVLVDIVPLPSGEVWAAGYYHFPGSQVLRTLAMHLPISCGPATATPTPVSSTSTPTSLPLTVTVTRTSTSVPATSTPILPSATTSAPSNTPTLPVAPTNTLTASSPTPTSTLPIPSSPTQPPSFTPTPCSIEFSDVPQDSTFYPFIQCLACKDILGGYGDGTFRPGNNLTRGQLAKIVSNAASLSGQPSDQMFEDVPQGSTFYLYVERVAASGIISGYPCGGLGEPCGSDNLPYFRPAANATRGQIAKIVSDAAGFSDMPPAQIFEDVAATHTFYMWVQRLASRSIMSGYPCGGPGEPCESPANLPYFRPAATTTRGQTSKIISNTFFPTCMIGRR